MIALELTSLVVSIVGLLRGIRKGKPAADNTAQLQTALEDMDGLFDLLMEAKNVHTDFETLESVITEAVEKLKKPDEITLSVVKRETKKILSFNHKLTNVLDHKWERPISESKGKASGLPAFERQKLKDLEGIHPRFYDAIKSYITNLADLQKLDKARSYGEEFEICLGLLVDSIKEVKSRADDVILSITPIISFLYYEIRAAVGAIL